MADPRTLSRSQLAVVANNDPDVIRSLERLFEVAGSVLPSQITDLIAQVSTAQTTADVATILANAAQLAADTAQAAADAAQVTASAATVLANAALAAIAALGTMSAQNANAVAITGGTIIADLTQNQTTLLKSSVALSNGAAAALGTLTNAPVAGNPTKWVKITDNGTDRFIPAW